MYDFETIRDAVAASWSAETSDSPEQWTKDNPSFGQCAVSACVLQHYLGGDLLNTIATSPYDEKEISHYYNLINGQEVDITRDQFAEGTSFTPGQPKTREFGSTAEYVLSFDATRLRYKKLLQAVSQKLGEKSDGAEI